MPRLNGDVLTDLVLEVFRFNGELLADGDALVADLGLTSARWQVLGAVALSPTPLPVAHLARNMGLTRQSVQRIANEMKASGHLRFATNPHHERAKLVLLTDKGSRAYEAAIGRWRPRAEALAKGLRLIDAATDLLRTIRQRLAEIQSVKPGGRHALEKHN
jgi:DNA-binding MarR family transcriptional regulator